MASAGLSGACSWSSSATAAAKDEPFASPVAKPILFGALLGGVVPRGGYSFLYALLCAYLRVQPPAVDRWLAALERRLPAGDAAIAWSHLC
jgi:hypothetical protein